MRGLKYITLFLLCLSSIAWPDSVVLDGQSDMDDALLYVSAATTSYATETYLYCRQNVYVTLLKFDLTGISGTIDSVSLKLRRHLPADNEHCFFYRVTTPWVEETGLNSEVMWDSASIGCPTCLAWTTPGGDYNASKVDSLTNRGTDDPDIDVYCQRGEGVGLAQLVQDWVDGTYDNYGIILKAGLMGVADTLYFYSSENFNETLYPRPKLYIEYTPDGGMSSARRRKIILGGQ